MKVKTKSRKTWLDQYKQVCRRYLEIKDDEYLDLIFGTIFANRLDSIPVWVHLIGAPSSGKTVIVNSLHGAEIYSTSTITGQTLISGKIKTEKENDPSMLPELNGKTWIIKDFTVFLSQDYRTVHQIMGDLRDAYDGTAAKTFGTGEKRSYKSKFGLISCVTSVIDQHDKLLAPLGERFLKYRLPFVKTEEEKSRTRKAILNKSTRKQTEQLQDAARQVLAMKRKAAMIPEQLVEKIIALAQFGAKLRTVVVRESYRPDFIKSKPEPELAPRLGKQLATLAQGLAMVREKRWVTNAEVDVLQKIVIGGIDSMRYFVLAALIKLNSTEDVADYASIAKITRIGKKQVERLLADLYILKIVNKKKRQIGRIRQYQWELKSQYKELLNTGYLKTNTHRKVYHRRKKTQIG